MRKTALALGSIALTMLAACNAGAPSAPSAPKVTVTTGFPDAESGYEKGVSACYAAQIGNTLVMAGGANFANVPAAEGGTKCFYSGIYAAMAAENADTLVWKQIGSLPKPLAYGTSIVSGDSIIFAGGSNADGSTAECFSVRIVDGTAMVSAIAPLSETADNTAGCSDGKTAFVVGGNASGKASCKVFARDLTDPHSAWQEIAQMPEPRVQPVCAAIDGRLYVWGGFVADSDGAKVHTQGLVYDLAATTWNPLPAPEVNGAEVTLSGGCAATLNDSTIVAFGGVNKDIFADAVSGSYTLIDKEQYMLQDADWYRFNAHLLSYNTISGVWTDHGEYGALARAGAAIAIGGNGACAWCIGGETKPGIRAAIISKITNL